MARNDSVTTFNLGVHRSRGFMNFLELVTSSGRTERGEEPVYIVWLRALRVARVYPTRQSPHVAVDMLTYTRTLVRGVETSGRAFIDTRRWQGEVAIFRRVRTD